MKTHLIIFLLTFSFYMIGKSQNPGNIRDSINYAFAALDQTFIPTGVLHEKASPSINWQLFEAQNDSITSISIWKGMYKTLRNGAFDESEFMLVD